MSELFRAVPAMAQILGDLYVGDMDFPWAKEAAERLKKMLPPQIQEPEDGSEPVPPQVQQKMAQMDQMLQQLTQQNHQLMDERNGKMLETKSREEIALMQEETKRTIALATIDMQRGKAILDHEIAILQQRDAQYHAADQAAGAQAADANAQQSDQAHQVQQQTAATDAAAASQTAAQDHATEQQTTQLDAAAAQPKKVA